MGKMLVLLYSLMVLCVPYIADCFQGNRLHYLPIFLCGVVGVTMIGIGDCINENTRH